MTQSLPEPQEAANDRPDPVHEMAERIAVPEFDYIGEPIGAVIDAATGHAESTDSEPGAGGDAGTGTED